MKRFIIYLLLVIHFGCSPQEKKWENAVERNTIAAYDEYLNEFPDGKYAAYAKDSIADLFCDSAINSKSIRLLKDFVVRYPENNRAGEVKKLFEELEWNFVNKSDNIDTVQAFINTYPAGVFTDNAKHLLDSLIYNPDIKILEDCMIAATKTYFGNPDSKVRTTATIKKVHGYDRALGYMVVEGMCTAFTNYGEYYSIPKYFKLTTDGKGNWSAVYVP